MSIRTLLLVVAFGVLAAAGAILLGPQTSVVETPASKTPTVAPDAEPTFRELALRLLTPRYGALSADVDVTVGGLPALLEGEIPIPENARVVGSFARRPESGPTETQRDGQSATVTIRPALPSADVVLDVPMSVEAALAFYQTELLERGWQRRERPRPAQGGFVASTPGTGRTYCRDDGSAYLRVYANERSSAPTDVRLSWHERQVNSPCEQPAIRRGMDRGPIPSLTAPDGSQTTGMGGGGGSDHAETYMTLLTSLDAPALLAHYEMQLTEAGWRKLDSGASGPLAWSTWEVRDEDGRRWHGLMFAIDFPEQSSERYVYLRVDPAR